MNSHFRPPDLPMTTRAVDDMPRRRWTVAEIEEMVKVGLIDEDERFELIDGDVVPMSPKGIRHESYKASLLKFWVRRQTDSYNIIQETTFRLDASSFLEPDFVFYESIVKVPQLAPANTLLAVEVSDSSLAYDMGRKAKLYARYNVPVLWVINVNTLETHVFTAPGPDGYAKRQLVGPNDRLTPDFAPELAVSMAALPLI
jgi:Uma2 family endonuclease